MKTKKYHGQSTASLQYDYDATGRLTNMVAAYGTSCYTAVGNPLTEDGPLGSDPITYSYHSTAPRLRTGLALQQTYSTSWSQSYGYDSSRRLQTVTSSAGTFTYAYDASWNLSYRTYNGSASAFGVNNFNQLTTIPGGTSVYDNKGNLTSDGSRPLSYDDENQLTRIIWGSGNYRTDLVYDGKQRLRKRTEYVLSGGSWSWLSDTYYIYDGMRMIQERDNANTPLATYGSGTVNHYYHVYGIGNITAMVDSAQALSASYRYDSFRNMLSSSGSMAGVNTHRFSSKMQLSSSVLLYYYGYRFFDPKLQRWPNRDPLGEERGLNLYGFVGNDPINWIDLFGLAAGDHYASRDAAAKDTLNDIYSKSARENVEYGGELYKNDNGTYSYKKPSAGTQNHILINTKCKDYEGYYHSHGTHMRRYDDEHFSSRSKENDKSIADDSKKPAYLVTPKGAELRYDPGTKGDGKSHENRPA